MAASSQGTTDFTPFDQRPETRSSASMEPQQVTALRADEEFLAAENQAAAGNEQAAMEMYLQCAAAAESAHEWYLVAESCKRIGDFLVSPSFPCELKRALRMYRRAAIAYEQCGLFNEARELFYRVSNHRLKHGRELGLSYLAQAELFVYWITAGYGYRPLRVVGTSAVLIVAFAIAYWLVGGVVSPETGQAASLVDCFYFSGITFTTVGYGDLVPAGYVRLVALSEGFLGAFMIGFFVVVLMHRLSRA